MNSGSRGPAPGTRPAEAPSQAEAAGRVREMFGRIAPRYDLLNHLLSFNADKVWRSRVARMYAGIAGDPRARVLDLCCGTGDLAFALRRAAPAGAEIIGSDFSPQMLARARAKAVARAMPVEFVEADALALPWPDAHFDLVTCAFGFRNLASYDGGLREIYRVLKPGGAAAILEFSEPRGVFGHLYRFYFRAVLPKLGGMISGDSAAYQYLPASVRNFPAPEQLRCAFEAAGFADARFRRWTGGIVNLHTGRRKS